MARERGQESQKRARLDQPCAGHVLDRHAAASYRLEKTGDAYSR